MVFFDLIIILSSSTLSPDIRVHRAGSQLKMSESQTKAGNQKKIVVSSGKNLSDFLAGNQLYEL